MVNEKSRRFMKIKNFTLNNKEICTIEYCMDKSI